MPTGLLPEPFVSWRIICLECNAAICPQCLPPRTRNREKVSASRSCIELDLCDTAASAIIQGRAHKLLANSSGAMFLRDEHHADPGQILALCDRCNSANPFAGARCGETRVDQVSKVASNHSRSGSLFPFFELQCSGLLPFCRNSSATVSVWARMG
jgi:hypothetical protein